MSAHVTRSSGQFDERAVLAAFGADRLSPHRWSNGPGDIYAPHQHAYHKMLFCLRGSITFHLVDDGEDIELLPGDRLDIEAGAPHGATVGPQGVECIEAARMT